MLSYCSAIVKQLLSNCSNTEKRQICADFQTFCIVFTPYSAFTTLESEKITFKQAAIEQQFQSNWEAIAKQLLSNCSAITFDDSGTKNPPTIRAFWGVFSVTLATIYPKQKTAPKGGFCAKADSP